MESSSVPSNYRRMTLTVGIASALVLATARPAFAIDRDDDGLHDEIEEYLLDRHRPILVYEDDERHWPHSAIDHVSRSQLIYKGAPEVGNVLVYTSAQLEQDPRLILRGGDIFRRGGPSNLIGSNPFNEHWTLSQLNMRQAGVYPGADGQNHRGMYGHVMPTRDGRILIQYWQLFPFSEAECVSDCGDHEADWVWIDVFVQDDAGNDYPLRSIVYHHHGSECNPPSMLPWPEGQPRHPAPIPLPADGVPVCYLEEQTHEWWPWPGGGGECFFGWGPFGCDNPSHHGNGIRYRVPYVINLGERNFPMPGNVEAEIVLMYNGAWGWWGSECFDRYFESPDGPTPRGAFYMTFGQQRARWRRYVDPQSTQDPIADIHGSPYSPYNSLASAANDTPANGSIAVKPGSYAQPVTISRPMTIEAWR
jgi:hypothetical protein